MSSKIEVSCPWIVAETTRINESNPFKKRMYWTRLKCRLCQEIVLGRPVTSQKDWEKIRSHLRWRHSIGVDEGIPVRLVGNSKFRKWFRKTLREMRNKEA